MSDFSTDSNGIQTLTVSPTGEAGIAIDGNFHTISGLVSTANSLITALQAAVASLNSTTLTKANNLSELTPTASTARTNLGLGSAATHASTDFDASGSASTVQTNLNTHISATGTAVHGLGDAATHSASDFDVAGAALAAIGSVNNSFWNTCAAILFRNQGAQPTVISNISGYPIELNANTQLGGNLLVNGYDIDCQSLGSLQIINGGITVAGGIRGAAIDCQDMTSTALAIENVTTGTTPSNTTTPTTWMTATIDGFTYQIPLYQ